MIEKPFRFTRGRRKHRIGRAHARFVIETYEPTIGRISESGDVELLWIGQDERGRELEIVAIEKPDYVLVVHVMPSHYRRKPR
jgi:hypothetical protein